MKNNYFKLASVVLGASLVLSSCVKTEELDSVKQMRDAKVNQMNAATALTNADVKAKNFKNSYDSLNNVYQLQINAANATYQVALSNNNKALADKNLETSLAQAAYNLAVAQSQLAVQVENAKTNLLNAQQSALYAQINFIEAQNQQLLAANTNGFKLGLINDYNTYYNGGSLPDGSYISNGGIFGLKNEIANENISILNNQRNKASNVNNNTTQVNFYEYQKVQAAVSKAQYERIIQYGLDAISTQDNTTAFNLLKKLAENTLIDYDAKNALAVTAENKRDTASVASDNASNEYFANNNIKNNAKNTCDNILNNYGVGTLSGLQTVSDQAALEVKTADSNLNEAKKEIALWSTQYDVVKLSLNTATDAKNSASLALQAAIDARDAANSIPPGATAAQLQAVTDKQALYDDAETAYNTALINYNSANNGFLNAQSKLQSAQNGLTSATNFKNSITSDIATYNVNLPIYDAANAKETALYLNMNAKNDQYQALNSEYQMAIAASSNAYDLYWSATQARNAMSSVIDGVANANEQVALMTANAQRNIDDVDASVAEYTAQIDAYSSVMNNADYDSAIAASRTKIESYTSLIKLYTDKATLILGQISAL